MWLARNGKPRRLRRPHLVLATALFFTAIGCSPDHALIGEYGGKFTGGSWNDLFVYSSRLVYFDERSGMNDHRFEEVLPALKSIEPLNLGLLTDGVTDASIPRIGELDSVEVLDIRWSRITAEGVSRLGALKHLKSVWVDRQHWSGADAAVVERRLPGVTVEFMP